MFLFNILGSLKILRSDLDTIESNYNHNNHNINKGTFCVHTLLAKEKNVAALEFLAAIQKHSPNLKQVLEAFFEFMAACYKEKSVISRLLKTSKDSSEGPQLLLDLRKVQVAINQSISLMNHFKDVKNEKLAALKVLITEAAGELFC